MDLHNAFYIAGAIGLLLLIGIVLLRKGTPKPTTRARPRGPANIRYVCTECTGEFTHSNRTISAWEKGSRRFFCNACHKDWRAETTAPSPQGTGAARSGPRPAASGLARPLARGKAPSGCLAMALLLVLVPAAIGCAALIV